MDGHDDLHHTHTRGCPLLAAAGRAILPLPRPDGMGLARGIRITNSAAGPLGTAALSPSAI
jgi:hypothetical protein